MRQGQGSFLIILGFGPQAGSRNDRHQALKPGNVKHSRDLFGKGLAGEAFFKGSMILAENLRPLFGIMLC